MDKTLEYVKAQLLRRAEEKQLTIIAEKTGVSLRTLYYIKDGRAAQGKTIRALHDYLKKNARRNRLDVAES